MERPGVAGTLRSSSLLVPTAYILKSQSTGKFYIGSALHLGKRLAEHERGHSPYTRDRGPWVLAYSEDYATLLEARRRERQIKSWKSSRSVQELIDAADR
jgi:putative endonuclease